MAAGWPLTGPITGLELVCPVQVYSPVQSCSPVELLLDQSNRDTGLNYKYQ